MKCHFGLSSAVILERIILDGFCMAGGFFTEISVHFIPIPDDMNSLISSGVNGGSFCASLSGIILNKCRFCIVSRKSYPNLE